MTFELINPVIKSTEVADYFLFPSTLFTSSQPHQIQTILGSCVAICLYDELLRQGGMNHFMLPWWNGKGVPSPKYGDVALERLLEKMFTMGSNKQNLVAKIFGGANQHVLTPSGIEVGLRNVVTAETLLQKNNIRIVARNVGGSRGRKIVFNTGTGHVFMKMLDSQITQPS